MQLTDRRDGYGIVSIALHWIVFALVLFLFVSGKAMEDLSPFTDAGRAQRILHASVGMLAIVFVVGRLAWRWWQGPLAGKDAGPRSLAFLSAFVQWALLAVLLALIVTGPLLIWADGRPIQVFDWFALASPLPRIEWLHEALEEVHGIAANALVPLVGLHVLGALKHLVVDRDGVFRRIFRPV